MRERVRTIHPGRQSLVLKGNRWRTLVNGMPQVPLPRYSRRGLIPSATPQCRRQGGKVWTQTVREGRQRVNVAVFLVAQDREYSALHSTQSPAHVFTLSVARFDTLMPKSVEKSSPQTPQR